MKFLKPTLISLCAALLATGCANNQPSATTKDANQSITNNRQQTKAPEQPQSFWINFANIDGVKKELGVINIPQTGIGEFSFAGNLVEGKVEKKPLADAYFLANDRIFAVFNKDSGKSVNPTNKDDVNALKTAKSFKFYDIAQAMNSTIEYSAPGGVCADFAAKKPVMAKSVTNYYISQDKFFTNVLSTTLIENKGFQTLSSKFDFNEIKNEHKELVAEISKDSKRLSTQDSLKQGRVLFDFCELKPSNENAWFSKPETNTQKPASKKSKPAKK